MARQISVHSAAITIFLRPVFHPVDDTCLQVLMYAVDRLLFENRLKLLCRPPLRGGS
jgi:hypothetical protein